MKTSFIFIFFLILIVISLNKFDDEKNKIMKKINKSNQKSLMLRYRIFMFDKVIDIKNSNKTEETLLSLNKDKNDIHNCILFYSEKKTDACSNDVMKLIKDLTSRPKILKKLKQKFYEKSYLASLLVGNFNYEDELSKLFEKLKRQNEFTMKLIDKLSKLNKEIDR